MGRFRVSIAGLMALVAAVAVILASLHEPSEPWAQGMFTLALGVLIGTVVQTGAKAAKEQVVAADATPLTIPNPVITQNQFTKVAKMLEPSCVMACVNRFRARSWGAPSTAKHPLT